MGVFGALEMPEPFRSQNFKIRKIHEFIISVGKQQSGKIGVKTKTLLLSVIGNSHEQRGVVWVVIGFTGDVGRELTDFVKSYLA